VEDRQAGGSLRCHRGKRKRIRRLRWQRGQKLPARAIRPQRGYSAKKHDASPAACPKTLRRQFDEKYDQKKVRNTEAEGKGVF
jgi:hypothetical protein